MQKRVNSQPGYRGSFDFRLVPIKMSSPHSILYNPQISDIINKIDILIENVDYLYYVSWYNKLLHVVNLTIRCIFNEINWILKLNRKVWI